MICGTRSVVYPYLADDKADQRESADRTVNAQPREERGKRRASGEAEF